jgi:hypothetical protein
LISHHDLETAKMDTEQEIAKQRVLGRHKFDTALRFLATSHLSQEEELEVLEKLALLRLELERMGEKF